MYMPMEGRLYAATCIAQDVSAEIFQEIITASIRLHPSLPSPPFASLILPNPGTSGPQGG